MTLGRRRLVRVPASSANLGPGFDVLAAALALHLELEVVETGEFAVITELDVPRDRRNLVVRAFERLHPADDFEFRIASKIPLSGGLGSSAAAIVAGLMAADHLFELDADVLALAIELEGHPDNVAAALEGGFVICDGDRSQRFEPPMGLEAVLVVPDEPVRTTEAARAALPTDVPMADAVFNVAHTAMLIRGLARARLGADRRRPGDRLHQPYRAHLYPRSAELLDAAAPEIGALGATISGAGPTVLVWSPLRADRPRRRGADARDRGLGTGDARPVRVPGRRRRAASRPSRRLPVAQALAEPLGVAAPGARGRRALNSTKQLELLVAVALERSARRFRLAVRSARASWRRLRRRLDQHASAVARIGHAFARSRPARAGRSPP